MTSYGATATGEAVLAGATVADNIPIWDGTRRGHYEVWYLTVNHRPSKTGFWIRYTLEAPTDPSHEPYAQLWFAAFFADEPTRNFALNRRFPVSALQADAAPFQVTIGDAVLGHGHARGALQGNGHAASWDLRWLPAATTHRHLPDLIYATPFADTRVLSPNLDVPVRGTITIDGQRLELDGEPGGQTHVWGRKHAHAWAWGHCNAFEGQRGAAFETLTAQLKRGPFVLPPLTVATLYLDGAVHRFTGLRDTLRNRGRFASDERGARYQLTAQDGTTRLVGEFVARPQDLVGAVYADPDGDPAYCANTEVGDLVLTLWQRRGLLGRWQETAQLRATGTAHFEVGSRRPASTVMQPHVTV
jgi:hypothetical protein